MIPRHMERRVLESLSEFPVVLITGARQVGKSTLVQAICAQRWNAPYLTLDDRNVLDAALTDPDELIAANPGPVALDEVQRAPDLLRAIKLAVDRHRRPGRFLLTGSANILTLKRVSETLAGRIALLELYPFSYAELLRKPATEVVPALFQARDLRGFFQERQRTSRSRATLPSTIVQGGYPVPALSLKTGSRSRWFEAYRKTYIERDIREIQAIDRLPDFGRLMGLVAARTGQVLNFAELGRDAGLPYATVRRYMNLLEQTYQVVLVPPYFTNVGKRLMKAPKIYWTDTGMASHLLGVHDPQTLARHPAWGALVETWVAQELIKLLALAPEPMRLYGWRPQFGPEVDFLIEHGDRLVALEVKAGRRVGRSALATFQRLQAQLKGRLVASLVLYGGEEVLALAPRCLAVPFTRFFGA